MEKDEWGIFSLQLAIVYKDTGQPSDDEFKEMPGGLKDVFDGAPTMFPVPSNAPDEIPRVMISSSDRFKIEVSKERISLFFQNDMDGTPISIDNSKEQLIKKAEEIYKILNPKIKWIGVILNSFNINDDPNTAMQALFTDKARTLVSSENKNDFVFDYSERKIHELEGTEYPGRLVLQVGSRLTNRGEQVGNSMIYDINTKDATDGTYKIKTIKALINKAFEEQEVVFDGLV
jgi:hypothetical protein